MKPSPIEFILSKLPDAKPNGNGWKACCPAHEDRNPSLSINEGDDGRVLLNCFAGCTHDSIVDAMGLESKDLFMPRGSLNGTPHPNGKAKSKAKSSSESKGTRYKTGPAAVAAVCRTMKPTHGSPAGQWTYHDAAGKPVALVLRFNGADGSKEFRPVSLHDGGWFIKGPATPRPLYGLPDIVNAATVYVCEGEKTADAARSLDLVAVTSMNGSQSSDKTDWTPLAGKIVIILPDNDEAGCKYAESVATILAKLSPTPVVKIVELPGLTDGDDLVEWIEAHGDAAEPDAMRQELETLVDATDEIELERPMPVVDQQRKRNEAFSRSPVLRNLADVVARPVEWLWPGRIPIGKLTLIAGEPGLGKSFLTMDLAARITTNRPWPDGSGDSGPPGSVILLSAEDDPEDTIRPRLDAAGADVSRINILQGVLSSQQDNGKPQTRTFCMEADLPILEDAILQTPGCRLIVIDPVSAYLGSTDSHKNSDIRSLLTPLAELSSRHKVAVLAVTHLNKNTSAKAMHRFTGSLAFIAAARAGWLVAADRDDEKRRLLLPVKNNLAESVGGLAYRIEDGAVVWEDGSVEISADDAISDEPRKGGQTVQEDASDWLRELLGDGPVPSADVQRAAKDCGFSWATVRRAKDRLGIVPKRDGFGSGAKWLWSLTNVLTPHEDAHTPPQ